ncbi:MAG: hypothetical protein RR891_00605 [Clostridium sp.]
MRINNKYGATIEWFIAIVLIVLCLKYSIFSYGSFSPIKAHEQSERTSYYGPSEVVETIDLGGGKIYLCRYKQWFSADVVTRKITWNSGGGRGFPIDNSKQISYSWSSFRSKDYDNGMLFYGYVTDPEITTLLFEDKNKEKTLRYDLDENRMFVFYWNKDYNKNELKYLNGLDCNGKVIYEENVFGF